MCRLCETKPYGVCKCGCGRPVGKHGCTAHSKRSQLLCNGSAVSGKCCCRMHAGKALRGVAHPNFKTGRFSIDLPARYFAATRRSVESPESRENRLQVGLLDARSEELLSQLSTGEHGDAWKQAESLLGKLRSRVKGNKQAEGLLDALGQVINCGVTESQIWSELLVLLAERRKMVETDSRIAFRQSVAMSREQAATLVAIIISAAREFIVDPADLRAFADRIEANTPGGALALDRSRFENA